MWVLHREVWGQPVSKLIQILVCHASLQMYLHPWLFLLLPACIRSYQVLPQDQDSCLPPQFLTCISPRLLRPPSTLLFSSHRWNQCQSFSLWASLGLTYIKMLKKRIKPLLALFLLLATLSEFLGRGAVPALPMSSSPVLLKPALWVLILYHLWNFSNPQHTSQP